MAQAQPVECDVGAVADFPRGTKKLVKVENVDVLIAHTSTNKILATSAFCPHYFAPLINGVLCGETITCQWHGACLNLNSGDIEDAPSINALISYPVRVADDRVYVTVTADGKRSRVPHLCKAHDEKESYVIVGGGAAALVAAETLRQNGFTGRVVMLSAENHLPSDRPKLSKAPLLDENKFALRDATYFQNADIEVHLNHPVSEVDVANKVVKCANGASFPFDKVLVATGGRARLSGVAGEDLSNVLSLRTVADVVKIQQALAGSPRKVVVVGNGFTGMELAWWFAKNQPEVKVTVMSSAAVPFARVLGSRIGAQIQAHHQNLGIQFVQDRPASYQGEQKVERVVGASGAVYDADLVLVCIGIELNTECVAGAVELRAADKAVVVNAHLQSVSSPVVYAAGDIAAFPSPFAYNQGDLMRIEHWDVAQQQGRVAALNMLGKDVPYNSVPYFWSGCTPGGLRFAGYVPRVSDDQVIIQGDIATSFVAFYLYNGVVAGVASYAKDPVASVAARLFQIGRMVTAEEVQAGDVDLVAKLAHIEQNE
eukprot:TRINITY_DN1248_c0_g1_i1.p1 TRINITY_DN1248_c0_g1~~TRINITY_DN1248_c0_g1_i1.p1  ORF type:complete len:566 (-),score=241.37 TRINITY_DN1248_c0_g1_i1:121-1746(-)